jgi:hypothetical protein
LHRIALPVVSEWYQQRNGCFTILLARGTHPKPVQHLAGYATIVEQAHKRFHVEPIPFKPAQIRMIITTHWRDTLSGHPIYHRV